MKNIFKNNLILVIILLLASLVRFFGINPGYHQYHSDEGMGYSSAAQMILNLNLDPQRYDYPSLIPLINLVIFVLLIIPLFLFKNIFLTPEYLPSTYTNLIDLAQKLISRDLQTDVLFWGRFVTALFGVGVVFLTYKLTMQAFKEKKIALISSFLVAFNFRHVMNSHLALPDIYNSFFLCIALIIFYRLYDRPTVRNYVLSGVAIGLYFSTKFQVFVLLSFVIVNILLLFNKYRFSINQWILSKNVLRILLSACVALIVILLINPYHILKWEEFIEINSYTSLKYIIGSNYLNVFALSYLYNVAIGDLLLISFVIGILFSLVQNTKRSLILFGTLAPFLFFFLYYSLGGFYTRNFITIAPLILIFSAVCIYYLSNFLGDVLRIKNKLSLNLLVICVTFVFSYGQIKNSLINSYYFSKPWGYELATNWSAANIPQGSSIISHPWDKYPRNKDLKLIPLETTSIYSIQEMQEEGGQYAYINLDQMTQHFYSWMKLTPFQDFTFWSKPDNLLINTFAGAAGQEVASWSVASFVKPWQAPDMNVIIVKVPNVLDVKDNRELVKYTFNDNKDAQEWKTISGSKQNAQDIIVDNNLGYDGLGAMRLSSGVNKFPYTAAKSKVFKIEENKAYTIEAWIKSDINIKKNYRDGFLKAEFYNEEPNEISLWTRPVYSAVSSRYYGDNEWVKKKISVIPGRGSKYMRVTAQMNTDSYNMWFDNITIYESLQTYTVNPRLTSPYIDYSIPDDVLFPYSHGSL